MKENGIANEVADDEYEVNCRATLLSQEQPWALADPRVQGTNPCLVADKFKCGQNHDGADDKSPNEYLAKKFEEMYDLYQGVAGKDFFSVRNYRMG